MLPLARFFGAKIVVPFLVYAEGGTVERRECVPLLLACFYTILMGMDKQAADVAFVSFCIERYALQTRLSGAEVIGKFEHTGVLDYLFTNYEALHTQGWGYIFPMINEYMSGREA